MFNLLQLGFEKNLITTQNGMSRTKGRWKFLLGLRGSGFFSEKTSFFYFSIRYNV
jgi:hypothetical protein